jgi:hypothetical protein
MLMTLELVSKRMTIHRSTVNLKAYLPDTKSWALFGEPTGTEKSTMLVLFSEGQIGLLFIETARLTNNLSNSRSNVQHFNMSSPSPF